jgi:hypothetical protein
MTTVLWRNLAGWCNVTALFPIMNATDNLAAAADLIASRPQTKNAHITSLCALCRSAVESAAKTIWLLSPEDRADRRARCIGFTYSELDAQRGFHSIERRRLEAQPNYDRNPIYAQFAEHVRLFDERVAMMNGLRREKPPNSSGFVTKAGKWIDAHLPGHDPGGLFANGFETGVEAVLHTRFWLRPWPQVGDGLRPEGRTGDFPHGCSRPRGGGRHGRMCCRAVRSASPATRRADQSAAVLPRQP